MEVAIKKALIIDLAKQTSEVKSFSDLNGYVGGIGIGLKLFETYKDTDPVVFSVGPLNGFFPFVSKTSVIISDNGVIEDLYVGGNLSLRIKFSGIDSIVICNRSAENVILDITKTSVSFKQGNTDIISLGLPGKRTLINLSGKEFLVQDYFSTPENFLEKSLIQKNISGMCITGTEIYKPQNFSAYKKLYYDILNEKKELRVDEGVYPSCSNCPMGCGKSKVGEIGGNVLIHSLVACHFADKIYSDIGVVFSCLNVLGYNYTHEDLENLPKLIEDIIKKIS
jgi:aldehyde:ferredoxin oxidoreductase